MAPVSTTRRSHATHVWCALVLVSAIGSARPADAWSGNYLSLTTPGQRTSAGTTIYPTASLVYGSPFTVEAWVYPTALPAFGYEAIIAMDDAYWLSARQIPNGQISIEFRMWAPGCVSDNRVISDPVHLPANTWNHVAGTFRTPGATLSYLDLWVNGVSVGTTMYSWDRFCTSATTNFGVGGVSINEHTFLGRIDEVRVSDITRYTANFTPEASFTCDANTKALFHFESSPFTSDPACGNYTLTGVGNPMKVELLTFTAAHAAAGTRLSWQTGAETDCGAFTALRCDRSVSDCATAADHTELADVLVPCAGDPEGWVYEALDASATADGAYSYLLREHDTNGATHDYGPALIGPATPGGGEPEPEQPATAHGAAGPAAPVVGCSSSASGASLAPLAMLVACGVRRRRARRR